MKSCFEKIRVLHVIETRKDVCNIVIDYTKNLDKNKFSIDFLVNCETNYINELKSIGNVYEFKKKKDIKKLLVDNNYNIVHIHYNGSIKVLKIAKKVITPVRIIHAHDCINEGFIFKRIVRILKRKKLKRLSTHYFCDSDASGKYLFGRKFYEMGHVYKLNNACNIKKIKFNQEKRDKIREKLNINNDDLVVFNTLVNDKKNNHKFLIEIFKEIHDREKNSILILNEECNKKNVTKYIKKLDLNNNVKFIEGKMLIDIYQAGDICLMPCLYGSVMSEAIYSQVAGCLTFLSKSMPSVAKILDSTYQIANKHSAGLWAKIILNKYQTFKRIDKSDEFVNIGYDISNEALDLGNKYESIRSKHIMHVIGVSLDEDEVSIPIFDEFPEGYEVLYVTDNPKYKDWLTSREMSYEIVPKLNKKNLKKAMIGKNVDIIHAHDYKAITASVGLGIPLVSHIHNLNRWMKKFNFKSIKLLKALRKSGKVLISTEWFSDEFFFKKLVRRKVEYIGYYYASDRMDKYRDLECEKEYDVVCALEFLLDKNPEKFIRIVSELKNCKKDIKTVIIGDGELQEEVKTLIIQFNLSDNIKVISRNNNLWDTINKSKVLVLVSESQENLILTFNSLSLGVPVILPLENLSDLVNGKVVLANDMIDDYVSSINMILSDKNISDECIKYASILDNGDKYINSLKNVYDKVFRS